MFRICAAAVSCCPATMSGIGSEVGDLVIEVRVMLARLVAGKVDREQAANWAMARIKDEGEQYSDPIAWRALDRLSGADLENEPGVYLHGEEDFGAWLSELDRRTEGR